MSDASSVDVILSQVGEREKEYNWLGATESCNKVLGLVAETDFFNLGQVQERLGYGFYRSALQAESVEQFRERMRQALAVYEKAKGLYLKVNEPAKTPRILRCDAMIQYIGYWLASEVTEKKMLLDECWRLTKEALKAFEEVGEAWEYGKTYNQLSISADLGYFFESNCNKREKTMREAVEHGERAINLLSTKGDHFELARAYMKTATYVEIFGYYFTDIDEKEKCFQKAVSCVLKANEFSEEAAMLELSSVLFGMGPGGYWGDGTADSLSNFNKALDYSRKTKDKFIIGRALDLLAYHTFWKSLAAGDPDERVKLAKTALQYAEEAKHAYSHISFTSPRGGVIWSGAPYAQHFQALAYREIDMGKKRELLEKAMEAAPVLTKLAEGSGYVDILGYAHAIFGMILRDSARIEANSEEKKRLFERALVHGSESTRITEQVEPFAYYNLGLWHGFLADIRSELAKLADGTETKKNMLQEAVTDLEDSWRFAIRGLPPPDREARSPISLQVGAWQYITGSLLDRLYELNNNKEHLRKAIEYFTDAAGIFQKSDLINRAAECYWKTAQTYSTLGEHLKAAEYFDFASNSYKNAAEKISQLKDLYQNHALYMQAWSEIEKARYYHAKAEYSSSREHYEKAAAMYTSLKQWSYLEPNYSAWAQVENAEDLSRREQTEEAVRAFEQAAELFIETKGSLQKELSRIGDSDEKQMITNIVKATDLRREYCMARIALEEARILDKKGDHYSSSEKYDSAAEAFEKIAQTLETEQDRKEFRLITTLSRAWQKMTLAEAKSSPALYLEASRLFEQAEDLSPNEKSKMLVLGHSRFCMALEAGTKFADTRDSAMHDVCLRHLASAANYYMKGDFKNASEYANATKLLFDAFLNMDKAEKESDPEKKTKLYGMAEKILQSSAGSYAKAEHPEKREQVLRVLEKVKEEQELAASLTEVLHTPSIISNTTAFPTPTPTHEEAVGLERFEHADIQANIIVRKKELKVGENLGLDIELVNAGKGPALLIKLAELIPEGFELTEKPEIYRVEDSYLNMKGKRLDPLKTEEIRLVLKPKILGAFNLKPRIHYLDENGKYKSYEPEPITITVKELGIKGWLKGER